MKEMIDAAVADALNQDCHCLTLDRGALARDGDHVAQAIATPGQRRVRAGLQHLLNRT